MMSGTNSLRLRLGRRRPGASKELEGFGPGRRVLVIINIHSVIIRHVCGLEPQHESLLTITISLLLNHQQWRVYGVGGGLRVVPRNLAAR